MLSRRSATPQEPNRWAEAIAHAKSAGRKLLDLTESNPTRAGLPYPQDALLSALAQPGALRYEPESRGLSSARRTVSQDWRERGFSVKPDDIVLTTSTSEAYSYLFKLLCDAGDSVLVPQPSYPLLEHLAGYESVALEPYRLAYDGAWHVDLDSVKKARSSRSRALVVVNPNNPTGSFIKKDELEALAELGLPLISDEVFASYPLSNDPTRAPTALGAAAPLVFCLDGLSKRAGLPQMKLAWVTVSGERSLVARALERLELIADTYLAPSTPSQLALSAWLEAGRGVRDAIVERVTENLRRTTELTEGSALSLLHLEGGWYAIFKLPNTRSEEQWVEDFVLGSDVIVQPGWFYDFEDEPYCVVSLLTPPETYSTGLERVVLEVDAPPSR